jgi:large subunit ribosomal protein MRP49
MTVNRRAENHTGPALMTVHFASPDKERTKVLDMKNRDVSEIVAQLMTLTNAKPVRPTAEETRQLQELEEYRAKSAQDRERMKAVMEQRRREEAILTQARGEAEAMKET